ncbi:MAG: 30S ribosomal protein S7 [Flavobacteriales bacterium]|nr:30S ribosomal protein S7 [Flavobacteriales bacterium]
MRKSRAKKRIILADPRYNDIMVTQFVNMMMLDGKKSLAYEIFYGAMDLIEKRTEEKGVDVFKSAIDNITPGVEVRSRRVGGATFQIPREIRPERKLSLAMKWMILFARKRNEKSMSEKLAGEIIAGSKEEGGAYKKKSDTHKMAAANKAFSHFRF